MASLSGIGRFPRPQTQMPHISETFDREIEIRVHDTVGSASVSPSGRDVVLASSEGLHIVDLDSPYTTPRELPHQQPGPPADVQWSPFAARDSWVVSTSGTKALVWDLNAYSKTSPISFVLSAHDRAITDINWSAHNPDVLATCSIDTFVYCWDLRQAQKPSMKFADWNAGATQVKWNRQDEHILASSHHSFLKIWDTRMGTVPLKVIGAHRTKIYGIDWNRIRSTGILTCGLDNSIKFWDYAATSNQPERVIRTTYPVWRARHTPFGWGVLALPQRGNNDLHLYDRRLSEGAKRVDYVTPVRSFSAHQKVVKEFLWRSRGNIDHGIDNRDFQLISWGRDRTLHLHRMDTETLKAVGYEKGKEVRKNMPMTRRGAEYKTFNIKTAPRAPIVQAGAARATPPGRSLLGQMIDASRMSKLPLPAPRRDQSAMSYHGKSIKRPQDPILWMSGVTMRSRGEGANRNSGAFGLDNVELLKDEMTTVSQRYTRVTFEQAEVHGRKAKVVLKGPWGADETPVFVRVCFEFPDDYPNVSPAICTLEKTPGGLEDEMHQQLNEAIKCIIDNYQARKLGCLEAVVTYLLGERALEDSLTIPPLDDAMALVTHADDSSSDDDDADAPGEALDASAEGALVSANANVPLAKACGAFWGPDGKLVCFFPPKPPPQPLFSLDTFRAAAMDNNSRRGQGFGRLFDGPSRSKRKSADVEDLWDINADEDSAETWTSSSASSTSSEEGETFRSLMSRFQPPKAWKVGTRKAKTSSQSGSIGATTSKVSTSKSKSSSKMFISIHDYSDLLPASRALAAEYVTNGSGPEVCSHNAGIARKHGYEDLSLTWELCAHLLNGEVPLEVMEQNKRSEPILVVAKKAMARARKDELSYDWAFCDYRVHKEENPKESSLKWATSPVMEPTYNFLTEGSRKDWVPESAPKIDAAEEAEGRGSENKVARKEADDELNVGYAEAEAAKRAMVREGKKKMKEPNVDREPFDAATVEYDVDLDRLYGRVKWGHHPDAVKWMIPELFDYYEKAGDIQMLAHLSCLFCEPATRECISSAVANLQREDLPLTMQVPGFSLDYYPSSDVAWSQYRNTNSARASGASNSKERGSTEEGYFDRRITAYGSAGSSNGPWERDPPPPISGVEHTQSAPWTPYSTGETPPTHTPHAGRSHRNSTVNSATPSVVNSLSASPEQNTSKISRRSPSNLTAAAFSLTRAFTALGTSPSSQERLKVIENDLSTSAPTSGITWGSTTVFSDPSPKKKVRRSRSLGMGFDGADDTDDSGYDNSDSAYESDEPYAREPAPKRRTHVGCKLKNQHLFDEEAYATVPLIDPRLDERMRAARATYALQLFAWEMHIQAAQILKFNGMRSYWPGDAKIPGVCPGYSGACSCHRATAPEPLAQHILSPSDPFPAWKKQDLADRKESHRQPPAEYADHGRCHLCLEPLIGLYITCATGQHKAHIEPCLQQLFEGKAMPTMWHLGVGCFCSGRYSVGFGPQVGRGGLADTVRVTNGE